MILQKLVKNISFKGQADEREIKAITYDSRKVKPGTLFVAISGFNDDGHEYIYQAIKNGAIAILSNGRSPITNEIPILQVKNPRKAMSKIAAEFYGYPSKRMNVITLSLFHLTYSFYLYYNADSLFFIGMVGSGGV